jgi:hypothetical protein
MTSSLLSLVKSAKASSDEDKEVAAFDRLEEVEAFVAEIESGSDKVFRGILHTRVALKAGNRVGFGRVDLSQTHARRPYRAQHKPMTRPMGLKSDPCPYPSGSQTRSGTHRASPI